MFCILVNILEKNIYYFRNIHVKSVFFFRFLVHTIFMAETYTDTTLITKPPVHSNMTSRFEKAATKSCSNNNIKEGWFSLKDIQMRICGHKSIESSLSIQSNTSITFSYFNIVLFTIQIKTDSRQKPHSTNRFHNTISMYYH